MYFSEHIIEQIKSKVIISEIVSKKVKLQKKGNYFTGLCPFHQEKTPSFVVSDEKGNYHCFGCGAHGDVISFVTDTTGVSFSEALNQLASQGGVLIPTDANLNYHNDLYQLMTLAKKWFEIQLKSSKNTKALQYLINRKLSEDVIEIFGLGFAPDEKNSLLKYLIKQGASHKHLLDAGLVIKSESDKYYDRFRGRIMFPIINYYGKIVGFGGRAIDNQTQPKYLNSPETILFKKREILFAENLAKQAAYKNKRILLVEGYMDVISMHNIGFSETVASLGTAVSKDHLQKLWKYANKPIICFDGDNAGARAMHKLALESITMITVENSLEFIKLPQGLDPDELAKIHGKKGIDQILDNKKTLSETIWSFEFENLPTNPTPEDKSSFERLLYNITQGIKDKTISSSYRSFFNEQLWHNVKKYKNHNLLKEKKSIISSIASMANCVVSELEKIERTLLIIIISHPHLLRECLIEENFTMIEFSDINLDILRSKILKIYFDNNNINNNELNSFIENEEVFINLNKWAKSNIPFVLNDSKSIWEYTFSKYRILLLEQEYKTSLEELTENADIKAKDIRNQILIYRNNILNLEQLLNN